MGIDLVGNPDLAADREIAAKIAVAYWEKIVENNTSYTSAEFSIIESTKIINGGTNGLAERTKAYNDWISKINDGYIAQNINKYNIMTKDISEISISSDTASNGVFDLGDKGDDVKELQSMLNDLGYHVATDGIFGKQTEQATWG
ncbi:MAG: peptidoglycan-binding protein [Sulfurovaceae bacterium]|nr:peptidoglycan-binding protein [Sulfurovaceae bacterium]